MSFKLGQYNRGDQITLGFMADANYSGSSRVEFKIDKNCNNTYKISELIPSKVLNSFNKQKCYLIYHPLTILPSFNSITRYALSEISL